MIHVKLFINGQDYSKYFLKNHSEQTVNDPKDENKYDITLANVPNGALFGEFKPKDPVSLTVVNERKKCDSSTKEVIKIFDGELQDIIYEEKTVKIAGACTQGGMTSLLPQDYFPKADVPIKDAVIKVLGMYGLSGSRIGEIEPRRQNFQEHDPPKFYKDADFNTTFQDLADEAHCIWFFDEFDKFFFIPVDKVKYQPANLSGYLLEGQTANNMIGLCTYINVVGGCPGDITPQHKASVIPTHRNISAHAEADADTTYVHLGALVLVRHFVQTVEQQQHLTAVVQQFREEFGRQIEVGVPLGEVVRDEAQETVGLGQFLGEGKDSENKRLKDINEISLMSSEFIHI